MKVEITLGDKSVELTDIEEVEWSGANSIQVLHSESLRCESFLGCTGMRVRDMDGDRDNE